MIKERHKAFTKLCVFVLVMFALATLIHEGTHALDCKYSGGQVIKFGFKPCEFGECAFIRCSQALPLLQAELKAYGVMIVFLLIASLLFAKWLRQVKE